MLLRHIIGYTPSLIVPGITAFLAVFAYTRLLSPAEYGEYALALNSMNLLIAVFYLWLQVASPRLMPQAIKKNRADAFRATAYLSHAGVSIVIVCVGVPLLFLSDSFDFRELGFVAILLALSRSILNLNQTFHRSYLDFKRYNIIECGQAIIGLLAGLGLVFLFNRESLGANLGTFIGLVCMLSVDIKTMLRTSLRNFDKEIFKEILRFGMPLVASSALSFVITSSDRYIIELFHGDAQVGIYSAGYTMVDRIITMLFMAVATPSFPLVVQQLEQDGPRAARRQMYRNGLAMLILVLPACAGLLLTNEHLVSLLIGEDFREGAVNLIPWIVLSSVLNGLSAHYFAHTFHLAKRSKSLFWIQIPVALLNLMLNFLLIPKFGFMGAAYATFASSILLLILTVRWGYRSFPFIFPFREFFQILACIGGMAAVLIFLDFPTNTWGLIWKIIAGCISYIVGLVAFDIMDVRSKILSFIASKIGV